jgi:hypothetical protein
MYTDRNLPGRSPRETMSISGHRFFLDTYICVACGYYAERIPKEQIDDVAPRIRKEWEKI